MFAESLNRVYRQLLGNPKSSDGSSGADILRAETSLGITLPQPLREYYLCFGGNKSLANAHDRWLSLEKLEVREGYLVFWEENQGVYWAGVSRSAVHLEDPPVFQQGNMDNAPWYPECRRLTDFILKTVCWQATWCLPNVARAEGVTHEVLARVAGIFPRIAPNDAYEHELVAYARDGVVICAFPRNQVLYVGATSNQELERVGRELGTELSSL
jgi:cell wall assembly regulator SMI1